MNDIQFQRVLEERIVMLRGTLSVKSKEYAFGDRLSNFKRAAEMQHITPEQVCLNWMMKHFVSVQDMIESKRQYGRERWSEKIGDIIGYMVLLEAIVNDETHDERLYGKDIVQRIGYYLCGHEKWTNSRDCPQCP